MTKKNGVFKKCIAVLFVMVLMITTIPVPAFALSDPRPRSGYVGEDNNIYWEIAGRVLTLTGNGAIPDYVESDLELQGAGFPESAPPWFDLTHHHYYNDWIYVDKIVIGEGITTVGDFAFARMKEYELVLPNSLVEVKTNSFFANDSLKSIILPPNLKKLGLGAFGGEYACTDIQLNDGLEIIGRAAFDGCQHIKSISIPDSVTKMGTEAFRNCYELESVRLSENLTEILDMAFAHTSLKNVEIPASVELIEYIAFSDIETLESVTFKEGTQLKTLGKFVFYNCTSLTDIELPDTLETMNTGVFQGCSALEKMEIPAAVSFLGNQTFRYCTALTSVTLHEGLTGIGDFAFEGCTALPDISIPNTVQTIAQKAFLNCTLLPEIDIPASVTSIGTSAFEACEKLAEVNLNEGLETIGASAFKNCTLLSKIDIPDTVTSIGGSAFNGCIALSAVTLGENVATIGASAFNGCVAIPEITVPGTVKSLGNNAFAGCTALTTATLQYGLNTIGTGVFKDCTALETVIIPDTASWATRGTVFPFAGCTALETIIIISDFENVNETNIATLVGKIGTASNWPDSTLTATVYVMKNSDAELVEATDDYATPANIPEGVLFDGWMTAIDGTEVADYNANRIAYANWKLLQQQKYIEAEDREIPYIVEDGKIIVDANEETENGTITNITVDELKNAAEEESVTTVKVITGMSANTAPGTAKKEQTVLLDENSNVFFRAECLGAQLRFDKKIYSTEEDGFAIYGNYSDSVAKAAAINYADLRFQYRFQLPEGFDIGDVEWSWKVEYNGITKTLSGVNYKLEEADTYRSNLVLTNIPIDPFYNKSIKAYMTVRFAVDGITYEIVQSDEADFTRSVVALIDYYNTPEQLNNMNESSRFYVQEIKKIIDDLIDRDAYTPLA